MSSVLNAFARVSATSGDIDWELLLLLARTEAALTWPELDHSGESDLSLPDGLDLRHPADIDWVSHVVEFSEEPSSRPLGWVST